MKRFKFALAAIFALILTAGGAVSQDPGCKIRDIETGTVRFLGFSSPSACIAEAERSCSVMADWQCDIIW